MTRLGLEPRSPAPPRLVCFGGGEDLAVIDHSPKSPALHPANGQVKSGTYVTLAASLGLLSMEKT